MLPNFKVLQNGASMLFHFKQDSTRVTVAWKIDIIICNM